MDEWMNPVWHACVLTAARSPMENHHLAAAFTLMRKPSLNFMEHAKKVGGR